MVLWLILLLGILQFDLVYGITSNNTLNGITSDNTLKGINKKDTVQDTKVKAEELLEKVKRENVKRSEIVCNALGGEYIGDKCFFAEQPKDLCQRYEGRWDDTKKVCLFSRNREQLPNEPVVLTKNPPPQKDPVNTDMKYKCSMYLVTYDSHQNVGYNFTRLFDEFCTGDLTVNCTVSAVIYQEFYKYQCENVCSEDRCTRVCSWVLDHTGHRDCYVNCSGSMSVSCNSAGSLPYSSFVSAERCCNLSRSMPLLEYVEIEYPASCPTANFTVVDSKYKTKLNYFNGKNELTRIIRTTGEPIYQTTVCDSNLN